ncbi:helix-turn-helix domain-containing protein [Neorhizobium galegae]|uniref:helix-turn-helix domain-containing protein n=1 Tax=Neorhizobium galegae TaxID=399 RepID=UPI001FD9B2C5|nr:helix-turn-helix transcriptional regulator [Neorhizobium galegae]
MQGLANVPGVDRTREPARLSQRKIECLSWIAQGKISWETGCILGISQFTLKFHLKLGSANRMIATEALKLGFIKL